MLSFAIYILELLGLYKTFEKAGVQGWKALIPFYSLYHLTKIANRKDSFFWYLLIGRISSLVFMFFVMMSMFAVAFSGVNPEPLIARYFIIIIVSFLFSMGYVYLKFLLLKDISESFKRGLWTTFGLFFLPFIFYPILGFSNALYKKNEKVSTV